MTSESQTAAGNFFHGFADAFDTFYDGKRSPMMQWIDRRFRSDMFIRYELTFSRLGNLTGKRGIDIGCGSGPYVAEALRRARAEFRDKAFHRVVLVREAVRIDELLVDAHRVAAKLDLRLDPRAVRFARRRRDRRRGVGHSRWPGWGSLPRGRLRAGGHPGGVCGQRAVVPADGFVRHPRAPGDLMLAGAAREERFDGRTEMRLQDVHSFLARC